MIPVSTHPTTEQLLEELNQRRPFIIATEYSCRVGQVIRATHFLNRRLDPELLFSIVRQATREEYIQAVGSEPAYDYCYEVVGENGGLR